MLGTFLGMLPGTLAIAGLNDRGFALFTNPGPLTLINLIGVVGAVAAGCRISPGSGSDHHLRG